MTTISATPAVNFAVAEAKSLPMLITNLEAIDPDLVKQLETKPLIASRTPWGVALASLIGMAAAHYGIGLDTNIDALLSGALVLLFTLAGSYLMRRVTKQPVAGIVATPGSTPPNAPGLAAGLTTGTQALTLLVGAGLALWACTATQVATTLADGQLVCQVGSAFQAMSATSGQPILAKGAAAAAVQQVCGLIGGVATALPAGTVAGAATVIVPPAVTVPLAP